MYAMYINYRMEYRENGDFCLQEGFQCLIPTQKTTTEDIIKKEKKTEKENSFVLNYQDCFY